MNIIIKDAIDLNNYLHEINMKTYVGNLVEGQYISAAEYSDYPVSQFNYLCARDVWDDIKTDNELFKDCILEINDEDAIKLLEEEALNWNR